MPGGSVGRHAHTRDMFASVPANSTAWHAPSRPGYDASSARTVERVLPMLADEHVVWLSTVRPDGTPHLVPTWFWWDGEALLVWSKPAAAKVRNLRVNPRLTLAVGDAHADFDVGLVEAAADLVTVEIPRAFFAKYAHDLAAAGLEEAAFRATYTQGIRIVPTRFLAWHGLAARASHRHPAPTATVSVAASLAGWLDRIADRLRGAGGAASHAAA
jgi:PPOX class probable F420-dependent enzyme